MQIGSMLVSSKSRGVVKWTKSLVPESEAGAWLHYSHAEKQGTQHQLLAIKDWSPAEKNGLISIDLLGVRIKVKSNFLSIKKKENINLYQRPSTKSNKRRQCLPLSSRDKFTGIIPSSYSLHQQVLKCINSINYGAVRPSPHWEHMVTVAPSS